MKSHRGLSSAVGAVFLIIVLTTGMTYVATSINTIGDFSEQVIVQDTHRMAKEKEAFEITFIGIKDGKLDGVIQNTGQIPLKISKLWIDEKGINDEVQKINVDAVIAIGDTINLSDYNIEYPMYPDKGYNMKFVTSRGEVQSYFVNSSDEIRLHTQFNALPQTVAKGFETTLLYTVYNNATSNNALLNLTPVIEIKSDPNTIATAVDPVEPASYASLKPGESVTFKRIFLIDGESDKKVVFEAKLLNGHIDNIEESTVTITKVQLAELAATSYTSQGYNPLSSSTSDLILHQENTEEPISSSYQMDQKLSDAFGTSIQLTPTTTPEFYTNNGTAIEISAGIWDVDLMYQSAVFPDSLITSMDTNGGMIFHFEDVGGGIDGDEDNSFNCINDIGKAEFAKYEGGMSIVNWEQNGGPHNSGSYSFDGTGDFLSVEKAKCNEVKKDLATIAGWFKADSGGTGDDYIYWAGKDKGVNEEHFSVHIDIAHHVVFEFREKNQNLVQCVADDILYNNDNWYHFVGVRGSNNSCELYINGVSKDTDSSPGASQDLKIDDVLIGAMLTDKNGPSGADFFQGSLDDIMYWQNFAMSSAQVTDLYNTNYGDHAHEVTYTFSKADDLGSFLSPLTGPSYTAYPMNFSDGKRDNEFLKKFTYSSPLQLLTIFGEQERLKLELIFEDFTYALQMTLRIDDNSLTDNSLVNLPQLNATFFPYNIYQTDTHLTAGTTSSGEDGLWITKAGSRAVLTDPNTNLSYGAIIFSVNGTQLTEVKDSMFIENGDKIDLVFNRPKSIPDDCWPPGPSCDDNLIPPGLYDGKILLVGYNDQGNQNIWKIDLGNIKVND